MIDFWLALPLVISCIMQNVFRKYSTFTMQEYILLIQNVALFHDDASLQIIHSNLHIFICKIIEQPTIIYTKLKHKLFVVHFL